MHLNIIWINPTEREVANAYADEQAILARMQRHRAESMGFALEQKTRPQTIGYALADSPVAQAAWVYEKFFDWTDSPGAPEEILSRYGILDNIMYYWLTNSGASSVRTFARRR